jgi:hypothetical protein
MPFDRASGSEGEEARAEMKASIEELPDPRNHHPPCAICGGWPRYLAVLSAEGRSRIRGAFALCNGPEHSDID